MDPLLQCSHGARPCRSPGQPVRPLPECRTRAPAKRGHMANTVRRFRDYKPLRSLTRRCSACPTEKKSRMDGRARAVERTLIVGPSLGRGCACREVTPRIKLHLGSRPRKIFGRRVVGVRSAAPPRRRSWFDGNHWRRIWQRRRGQLLRRLQTQRLDRRQWNTRTNLAPVIFE